MKSKWNPVSVGSFVIGGAILLAIGLMSFQSLSFFNKPIRFVSYFDQSVQGLGVGSNIKMRGVLVGRIVALNVYYDWKTNKSAVVVIGEINKNQIIDDSGKIVQLNHADDLERLIQHGLKARIDLIGITGMQFVQLDFSDTQKEETTAPAHHPDYLVIPTVDSGLSKFTENLSSISEKLNKIDIVGISKDLNTLITTLNKKTEELDVKKLSTQITATATAVQQLADFLKHNPSSIIFGRRAK